MTAKSDSLLRDFAMLFVKYKRADWQVVINLLSDPDATSRLAETIRKGCAAAEDARSVKRPMKARRMRSAKAKNHKTPPAPRFAGPNADAIDRLRSELLERKLLSDMAGLRASWVALGIKADVPKRREAVIAALTQHLDGLDDRGFEESLSKLMREQQRENPADQLHFQRWFDLITNGTR